MHSIIFQVSEKPIDKADYIDESNYIYDHWFTNSVADYVSNSCYRDEDLKWFEDCAKGITCGKDENGEYFIITSKEEYFESAFNRFKKLIDDIKDCTINDFAEGIDEIWSIKNVYEDKYGFYVDIDDDLMSLDSFVRLCNKNVKYYIGGTVDYHC